MPVGAKTTENKENKHEREKKTGEDQILLDLHGFLNGSVDIFSSDKSSAIILILSCDLIYIYAGKLLSRLKIKT